MISAWEILQDIQYAEHHNYKKKIKKIMELIWSESSLRSFPKPLFMRMDSMTLLDVIAHLPFIEEETEPHICVLIIKMLWIYCGNSKLDISHQFSITMENLHISLISEKHMMEIMCSDIEDLYVEHRGYDDDFPGLSEYYFH